MVKIGFSWWWQWFFRISFLSVSFFVFPLIAVLDKGICGRFYEWSVICLFSKKYLGLMRDPCLLLFGCFLYVAITFLESSRIGRFGSWFGLGLFDCEENWVWILVIDSHTRNRTLRSPMRYYFRSSVKYSPFHTPWFAQFSPVDEKKSLSILQNEALTDSFFYIQLRYSKTPTSSPASKLPPSL